MVDKICLCGHVEKYHSGLDKTIEKRFDDLVKQGVLIPAHHPERSRPIGYIFRAENNDKIYLYEDVVSILMTLRENYSSCKKGLLVGCKCNKFKADNLKYLEELSEHSTS